MNNNQFRNRAYTILGGLVFVLLILACTTAVWATPESRFIPPEYLAEGEPDDGKYAEMINKGMLCDMAPLVLSRFEKQGYVPAISSQSGTGFKTVIFMKYVNGDNKDTQMLDKLAILEFPPAVDVACVVFEGMYPTINNKNFEIYVTPNDIKE